MTSSKKFKKQLAGARAKSAGDAFELHFQTQVRSRGGIIIPVPAGGRMVKSEKGKKWIPKKSPFDFIVAKNSYAAMVDTKTVESTRFGHSSIDSNQLGWLDYAEGAVAAGYVVWFRTNDAVVWFPARYLKKLKANNSLSWDQGLHLGNMCSGYDALKILEDQPIRRQTTLFDTE